MKIIRMLVIISLFSAQYLRKRVPLNEGDIVVMYSNNDGSIIPIKVDANVVRLLDIFRSTFLSDCEVDTTFKYILKQ